MTAELREFRGRLIEISFGEWIPVNDGSNRVTCNWSAQDKTLCNGYIGWSEAACLPKESTQEQREAASREAKAALYGVLEITGPEDWVSLAKEQAERNHER